MSIPLVQEATKDAINTSIIAIKRNIERINMLLGLSNSEEIDTSKFATKEELQQAVTDLQPVDEVALNNMHSVTSNAVYKKMNDITEITTEEIGFVYNSGYSANVTSINGVKQGSLLMVNFAIAGISGSFIGTTTTAPIGKWNIRPLNNCSFLLYDYNTGNPFRIVFDPDGNVYIGESMGITSGSNQIRGNVILFVSL